MKDTYEILRETKEASRVLANASNEDKNRMLAAIADSIVSHTAEILEANALDIEASREKLGPVMIDRLSLSEDRIRGMADGIRDVISLPDPVGKVLRRVERPSGIVIEKTSVPMGVIAIIYESRPNVTSDAAALALKSGNAVVLRGGKESFRSNYAIVGAIHDGLESAGFPKELVGLIEDTTRESAGQIMTAEGYIDLLIPRGGAGLIKACTENAKVPCIETGTGICHVFVDATADQEKAINIINNAKTSRPSVCNAEEVLLVHKDIAEEFLPKLQAKLVHERVDSCSVPVELRLDETAASIISGTKAGPDDFDTEFLNYILAVGVVGSVDEAIEHIAKHSTGHSDCIVTEDPASADKFTRLVDSAAVYVNASTRFTDGGEFGLGCEMGISTQKLHARGPMGLEELNTYKYIIKGDGQIR
jgi:glutamate-5-semialdehyde dehydrogenase